MEQEAWRQSVVGCGNFGLIIRISAASLLLPPAPPLSWPLYGLGGVFRHPPHRYYGVGESAKTGLNTIWEGYRGALSGFLFPELGYFGPFWGPLIWGIWRFFGPRVG